MKTPNMNPINFVTGTLGSGKSGYATRTAFRYLAAGKMVALNYDLTPYRARHPKTGVEWPEHPYHGQPWWRTVFEMKYQGIASRYAPSGPGRWSEYQGYVDRCLRFEEFADLFDYELPGDPEKEDRGLLVIDEGALRANSRSWRDREKANKDAGRHALSDLQFMLHVRKLGWTLLLLTQGFQMIDSQYRMLGPVEIKLRNFQKMTIPLLNIPMARKPRFMAAHYQMEADFIQQREYYGLDRCFGHYRSSAVFRPDQETETGLRPMAKLPHGSALAHPDDVNGKWWMTGGAAPDAQSAAAAPVPTTLQNLSA